MTTMPPGIWAIRGRSRGFHSSSLISTIENVVRLVEQFDCGASWLCLQSSVILTSTAARLQFASQTRYRNRAKGEWRSDSPHQSFSIEHIFWPPQLAFTRNAAREVCPICEARLFPCGEWTDPWLHSGTPQDSPTLSIPQLRSNRSPSK